MMYGATAQQPYYYNVGNAYNYAAGPYQQQQAQQVQQQQAQQIQQQQQQHDVNGPDTKGYSSYLMAQFISDFAFDILYEYVPSISSVFIGKLSSVLDATRLSKPSVLLGMTYLYRKKKLATLTHYGELQYGLTDERRIFLYIIVSLIIANKYNDDNTFTNRSWSNATGIPIEELNKQERDWLTICNYDLHFSSDIQSSPFLVKQNMYSHYSFETRPWLLVLMNCDRFFNAHKNLIKDPIYASNDASKRSLSNGSADFFGIEAMYNYYESHRALRSPVKKTFDYSPRENFTSTNTNNNYMNYYAGSSNNYGQNSYTSGFGNNSNNYMMYNNNGIGNMNAYDDSANNYSTNNYSTNNYSIANYSTSFNNGLPTPKSPYDHTFGLNSEHKKRSGDFSGYSVSPTAGVYSKPLSTSGNNYAFTANNTESLFGSHAYGKSSMTTAVAPGPAPPINPSLNGYHHIAPVTQLPPLQSTNYSSNYHNNGLFRGSSLDQSGVRFNPYRSFSNEGNNNSNFDYFARNAIQNVPSVRYSNNRPFQFFS